jgi:hydrogenase maturation protein HypF
VAPIGLPGGDAAAREPWRMAASALAQLGRGDSIERRFSSHGAAAGVAQMLARGLRCPPTSSLGRWFDAAAGLLGVREVAAYEGQAAMLLEALARRGSADIAPAQIAGLVSVTADLTLDPTVLVARLADEPDAQHGAALFHHALADGIGRWVLQAAKSSGLRTVALGGGCFLNALLTGLLVRQLTEQGLRVLEARQAPPNDGGIALGQAWVAVCRMNAKD